jgi:hypothetical protein
MGGPPNGEASGTTATGDHNSLLRRPLAVVPTGVTPVPQVHSALNRLS